MNYKIFSPQSGKKAEVETGKLSGDLARTSGENTARIEMLEQTVARLSLLSEALWQVLQDKASIGEAELNQYVETVVQQRKARSEQKLSCQVCGHLSVAIKPVCMYCGGKLMGEISKPVFPC